MNNIIGNALKSIGTLIYPSRCGACQQFLSPGRNWCPECWVQLSQATGRDYCPSCGSNLGPHQVVNSKGRCPLCKKIPSPLEGICRLGVYENALARAIKNFKYHHSITVGNVLGDMLAEVLTEQKWFDQIEALCPVPIHWTRRIDRGFNQSQLLAERISVSTRLPVIKLLKRTKPTLRQVGLSPSARKENLKDAFILRPLWPVTGTKICLVDDIMTTGSTLFEAARTLLDDKADEVFATVLAKADHIAGSIG